MPNQAPPVRVLARRKRSGEGGERAKDRSDASTTVLDTLVRDGLLSHLSGASLSSSGELECASRVVGYPVDSSRLSP